MFKSSYEITIFLLQFINGNFTFSCYCLAQLSVVFSHNNNTAVRIIMIWFFSYRNLYCLQTFKSNQWFNFKILDEESVYNYLFFIIMLHYSCWNSGSWASRTFFNSRFSISRSFHLNRVLNCKHQLHISNAFRMTKLDNKSFNIRIMDWDWEKNVSFFFIYFCSCNARPESFHNFCYQSRFIPNSTVQCTSKDGI